MGKPPAWISKKNEVNRHCHDKRYERVSDLTERRMDDQRTDREGGGVNASTKTDKAVSIIIPAIFIAIESRIILRLTPGSIGFDHPGSTGLDFDKGLQLGILLF